MSRAAVVIILIGIILLGLWWIASAEKAIGESPLKPSEEESPSQNMTTTTTLPPPVTGKFVVELLGDDGSVLTTKQSILYAFIPGPSGGYSKVDKIRFRIEGINNPTFVEIRMTVFKVGDVTQPPITTTSTITTYISPSPTLTVTPPPEESSPTSPEPTITTTTTTAPPPTYTVPEPPGGPGPPHYYPISIVADNVQIYNGVETTVVFDASYLFMGYEDGVYEVRFWAWVGTGEQTLISDYVIFKVMVYNYDVFWVPD